MPVENSAVLDDPATGTTTGSPATDDAARATTGVQDTTQTSQQTDPAAGATDDTAPEEVSSGLLSQAEYDKVKDDPAAFRKALLKGFTQKTQQLASDRKELGSWATIREAFQEDPLKALKGLAAQFDVEIRDPEKATAQGTATTQAVTDAGDQAVAKLKTVLTKVGLDEIADELSPIIREIAEAAAGKATEPYRSQQEQLIDESAQREANATLEAFGKSHPDWKPGNDVDKAMAVLSKKLPVARDEKTGKALMTDTEYLEHLHFLATKDTRIAEAAQAAVDRMTKSAAAAAEGQTRTVAGTTVTKKAPANATFNDAAEAAKAGVRWE